MSLLESIQTELIAGGVTNSISVSVIPQNASLPAIVLTQISENHFHHLTNSLGASTSRVQISIVADRYDEAKDLNEIVRMLLDMGNFTWCDTIIHDGNREQYFAKSGTDEPYHSISSDYLIIHPIAIPVR